MGKVTVSKSRDGFLRDGKPFFYLADTVWMTFSNSSISDWDKYLDYRSEQGFNAVQISVLPVLHDTSVSDLNEFGFKMVNGKPDFYSINDKYFDKAEQMVAMAYKRNFVPVLFPLWCNYVPGTWAANRVGADFTMPFDAIRPYYQYILNRFAPYQPIYGVSGDTRFETKQVSDYYFESLRIIKELSAESLTTMHLTPIDTGLPQEFIDCPDLDFYMYQSGHDPKSNDNPYKYAELFYKASVKRPTVNGEPCYEGHGHACVPERFNAFEVRMASWQSLLSGSKAGITYGAHGMWSYHRKDMAFTSELFSGRPYVWETVLRFPGAWDVAFAKWIFETYDLFDIEPCQCVLSDTKTIRMSRNKNKVIIYAPYDFDVIIDDDLSGYEFSIFILEEKKIAKPTIVFQDGKTIIKMHSFNSDVLIVGSKK